MVGGKTLAHFPTQTLPGRHNCFAALGSIKRSLEAYLQASTAYETDGVLQGFTRLLVAYL